MTPRKPKDSCSCCLHRLTGGNPFDYLGVEFLSGQYLAFCVAQGTDVKQLIEDRAVHHHDGEQVRGIRQRVRSEAKAPRSDLPAVKFAGQAPGERPGRVVDGMLLAAVILGMAA